MNCGRGEFQMPIEWSTITPAHVRQACEFVAASSNAKDRNSGLVVFVSNRRLSAKEILREAYRLANGLTADAEINFASGEATLNLLRRLGFRAERLSPPSGKGVNP
jgi:hypothetical protein